jgi:preprotein translocase subunit SecD
MKNTTISLLLVLFISACSHKTESIVVTGTPQFQIAASDVSTASFQSATNRADLVAAHKTAVVDVVFSSSKAAELGKFTREHLNQQVQILVGSKIVAEPWIRSEISGGEIELNFTTPEEAQAVVDSLTKK